MTGTPSPVMFVSSQNNNQEIHVPNEHWQPKKRANLVMDLTPGASTFQSSELNDTGHRSPCYWLHKQTQLGEHHRMNQRVNTLPVERAGVVYLFRRHKSY